MRWEEKMMSPWKWNEMKGRWVTLSGGVQNYLCVCVYRMPLKLKDVFEPHLKLKSLLGIVFLKFICPLSSWTHYHIWTDAHTLKDGLTLVTVLLPLKVMDCCCDLLDKKLLYIYIYLTSIEPQKASHKCFRSVEKCMSGELKVSQFAAWKEGSIDLGLP